jgi:hypothetical protein
MDSNFWHGALTGAVALFIFLYALQAWLNREHGGWPRFHWDCPVCGLSFQFWEERYFHQTVGWHYIEHQKNGASLPWMTKRS